MKLTSYLTILLVFVAGLQGCMSLAPEYKRPELPLTENFKEVSSKWVVASPSDHLKRQDWWKQFQDPILDGLVEKTNNSNFQLAAALARYEGAAAIVGVANSGLYPQLSAVGQGSNNKQSALRPLRGVGQDDIYDNNFISGVLNYEIDLWGRVRSTVESAKAISEASRFDLESVRLLIQANIVSAYINLRTVDSKIDVLKLDLEAYKKQANLTQKRFQVGIAAGSDYYRIQSIVENQTIQLRQLESERAKYEHEIAVLVGESPSSFSLSHAPIHTLQLWPVKAEIPSTLLQRRPDVAAAERRVASTNADIGIAKSAYFPVISLSAIFGYQTSNESTLINSPNAFWSIGPLAFFNIFDGGRRSAIVDQTIAKNSENIALYKNTVLTAIKEVEDVMVDLKSKEESYENVSNNLNYLNKNYQITEEKFKQGIANYLEFADAAIERSKAEVLDLDYRSKLLLNRVLLVKALGGSWE